MAKDDLNFNLDEFLASHSQGTKHMHSPKKKRAQSSRNTSKTTSSASKKVSDEKIQKALSKESLKNDAEIIAESESFQETEQIANEILNVDEQKHSDDSFENISDVGEAVIQEELLADDSPILDNAQIQDEGSISDSAFAEHLEEKTDIASSEAQIEKPEEIIEEKPQDLPKYKERTTEINFPQTRLSDTATVGVRKLKKHEIQDAQIFTKSSDEGKSSFNGTEKAPSAEELRLAEQLRRDRELTEKILRRAYEQEAERYEFGQADDSNSEIAKAVLSEKTQNDSKKQGKIKRNRKSKKALEEERALPVVQVGGEAEDSSQSIIDVLENALDEDVMELEYVSKNNEENHSYETTPEKKKNIAQTLYFVIGLFFTIMSVIGIVVTAKSAVKYIKSISDDSKQKQEFAEYIYPVVITDPAAFASVNDLSDEAIIKAALWDIIMYDDSSKYEQDSSNNMYVPYIQVENHAKSLFGTTNIVHGTVVFSQELTFFYDSENRIYKVPISPQLFPNTPVVTEIDKVGERYTLTVDYQEPTPNWALMDSEYTPGIKKTMEYILTKYNDGYTIISINNTE